jgi:predicted RNA methylase
MKELAFDKAASTSKIVVDLAAGTGKLTRSVCLWNCSPAKDSLHKYEKFLKGSC